MAQKTLAERFHVTPQTVANPPFWNGFVQEIDVRIRALDAVKIAWEEVSQQGITVALGRINEVLGPAANRIQNIAALGFLSVRSATSATLDIGSVTFAIDPGVQRELFVPSPFVAVTRESSPFDYAIGIVSYFNRDTGVMDIQIQHVEGDAGPHQDWIIAAVAGQAIAQTSILNATKQVKAETDSIRTATDSIRADTGQIRNAAGLIRDETARLRTAAETAKDTTVAVASRYHGARTSQPPVADIGDQYLDTAATPNVVKVLTDAGWTPTVTVSIGGSREVDFPVATGAEGTGPFTVGGGFTRGDVFLNGYKLRSGDGGTVILAPGPTGTFTLTEPLVAGDEMAFRGYLANDVVDIYTKTEAKSVLSSALLDYHDRSYIDALSASLGESISSKLDKSGGTITGALKISSAANYLSFADTDAGQTRHIHHNGGLIGFLGAAGDWIMRSTDDGALWTKQLGDLNSRIEARAAAHANDRVASLSFRRVSPGYMGANQDAYSPAGTVLGGFSSTTGGFPNEMNGFYYFYLQMYDPVRGWWTIGG
ncbi:hypothetical protein LH464_04425 [Neorhizobium sp. T786]|uniref:hypothetical protein n=1 Tax=Pseudorhizobium xiangyangii TaxID=2883104 RepID=UPI001CFF895A|nr:hypothetical protein [Neorhizobium xiangyangii]MCB5201724.1 hypothetical protein [Neorhizobium xiangyangii]